MKSGNWRSWFKGLRGKLFLSAMLPVMAFAVLTGISLKSMNNLGDMLTDAYTDVIPNMDGLGRIGMQRARIGYFIWASLANQHDQKSRDNFIKKAKEAFADFKEGQAYYESTRLDEEEQKNYAKAREIKDQFYALTESMIAGLEKNTPEDDAKVHKAMNGGDWHVLALHTQAAIASNMELYNKRSLESNKLQQEKRAFETQLLLLIAAFCATSLFGILMWIAYRVSNTVSGIAAGLDESGSQVASAITQLSAAGQTLSQSSTEAAASLEETVASLEEMSSMVKMNSDNAKQAAALSQSSKDAAETGQQEIQHLIESMRDISSSSKKIEEIISVIDDIAFQTNLLALNASVEAARAGEHGKGFAVVAEAVRTLAQRSAVAAKDINGLIKESVEKVEKGSSIADRSGEVLSNIVNSVKKVSDLNNEISAASSEQTTGIQQISKAMNQLDQSAQSNAASSEEVAASAEEINAQALNMKKMVGDLNAVILGAAEGPMKAPVVSQKPAKKEAKILPFQDKNQDKKEDKKSPEKVARPVEKKSQAASSVIPFDDDGPARKVGTTDGF
ncbi:MAG: chemotaxis protein [Bdellovibrio sp. ArHS]|uniref:HAMP domain-containing methyl-accepting chemotaxis protein n=1 Tax=Bdellovibrio sp. ArHS TaxID=1569284 RepID=UPI0005830E19|nr:methyl-accepting chemotaxis protein [Bdellovibrio sp. ArHS]KHD87937.1 MAG: chemotaxis protein [Bdellovibrio sp. ArHS]